MLILMAVATKLFRTAVRLRGNDKFRVVPAQAGIHAELAGTYTY
jgi:hypothetical protein